MTRGRCRASSSTTSRPSPLVTCRVPVWGGSMVRRGGDHRRSYLYTEAVVIGRVLDENVQSVLRMMPSESGVSPPGFFGTVDTDFSTTEMSNLIDRTFDVWLRFYNVGPREVGFRIPTRLLSA